MRELAALGLEVHPLIAGPPNLQGQAALMRNPKKYIDAAVAEAVRNNYSGYNFDNELRGKFTEGSWAFLRGAKNAPFEPFLFKKRSFYQDRLGTNIGKVGKRGGCCMQATESRGLASLISLQRPCTQST